MHFLEDLIWRHSPDALLVATQTEVLAANPAARRLFAVPSGGELAGRHLDELFPPESHPLLLFRLSFALTGGPPQTSIAERILRPDGQVREVEMSVAALPGQDAALVSLRDVTERRQVEAALAITAGELRALARRRDASIEEERRRIAREIHDELGQQLTLAKLRLAALQPGAAPALAEGLETASHDIDEAIRTVRRIATELRPAVLDALGLPAAIEWQARVFREQTGIALEIVRLDGLTLDQTIATAFFRILQEALTNVVRHSHAATVHVSLYQSGGHAVLEVQDDGRGMDPARRPGADSLGLLGMRERATLLGGTLAVDSEPGRGTKLTCRVPLGGGASADPSPG